MKDPQLVAEIPGGSETFPPDGQEHVHGRWMMLESTADCRLPTAECRLQSAVRRLFIAHNGLHGFDWDGREVRLSVLRSAAYCHEQGFGLENGPYRKFMDIGVHDIRLAIWENSRGTTSGGNQEQPVPDPGALADWLITPPLVWPHLPVGG